MPANRKRFTRPLVSCTRHHDNSGHRFTPSPAGQPTRVGRSDPSHGLTRRWREWITASENRRVLAATISGGVATLVAIVFVVARDLLIANAYGVSRSVD